MKIFVILCYLILPCLSQALDYKYLERIGFQQFKKHRSEIPKKFRTYFVKIIESRDRNHLEMVLSDSNYISLFMVEGIKIQTGTYAIFEELELRCNEGVVDHFYNSRLSNSKVSAIGFIESAELNHSVQCNISSFSPRNYYYGPGCQPTQETYQISDSLETLAIKDSSVIENYCKMYTSIDFKTSEISISFIYPVAGKREFIHFGYGSFGYPAGIEHWLFPGLPFDEPE